MLHFKLYEHVAYREGIQSSFSNTDRTVTLREAESLLATQAQEEDAGVRSTMCEIQEVTQKRHCLRTHMLSYFFSVVFVAVFERMRRFRSLSSHFLISSLSALDFV